MLCQDCNQKPATVHVTKIINNEKTERHLCEECAAQEHHLNFGINPDFSLHQFFSNLLNYDQPFNKFNDPYKHKETCTNCGLSYDQFVRGGKMGCRHCYQTFNTQIDNLLKKIHGTSTHVGKAPERTGEKYRLQRELSKLRQGLSDLIHREEFEKAAEIRDKIKALESELGHRG